MNLVTSDIVLYFFLVLYYIDIDKKGDADDAIQSH